ncbi:MAG: C4-dicarboxylate TRAP transporter substrate-binding protein [Proteobacteria bacterium]|nr:C4-dicarboxylate TRAP transporter substrate-binding protein [Pseudomonadota bacterium]
MTRPLYMNKPTEWFSEKIKERTGGKIDIKLYYSGALGKANEILPLVSKGAIDMGALVQGYFTSNLPFAAMTNSLPMTFFDPEVAMYAAIALEKTNQSQIDEFKKNNIKPLVYRYLPNYKLICTKPVRTMADLKKLKVRTFGNYMPKMFAAIDVTPVNVLPTDNYEALKRGTMDCSYLTDANFLAYKLHEVAKYIIDVKFGGIHAYFLAMNLDKFNAMPANVQKLFVETGLEATKYSSEVTKQSEADALKTMVAAGAEIVKFEDQDKLNAAVPDMVKLWIEEMAGQGLEKEAAQYASEVMAYYNKHKKE